MAPHAKEVFTVLLRGLERRGHPAVHPERLRGYFRERAKKASGLLCARLTGSRKVLRAAGRGCALARHRERTHSRRGVRQARSKSSLRAARLIVQRSTFLLLFDCLSTVCFREAG